ISSGTSGFFFCGMIDEPVQKRSGKNTKLNCALVHNTNSSEKRDICVINKLAKAANSIAKSRSETESSEFSVGASNPSNFAVRWRSIGYVVPASAAAPSGD